MRDSVGGLVLFSPLATRKRPGLMQPAWNYERDDDSPSNTDDNGVHNKWSPTGCYANLRETTTILSWLCCYVPIMEFASGHRTFCSWPFSSFSYSSGSDLQLSVCISTEWAKFHSGSSISTEFPRMFVLFMQEVEPICSWHRLLFETLSCLYDPNSVWQRKTEVSVA
jgi:hypothetical protein